MYHSYFGLDEQAFSIAVNPRYLYMSTQHREALAHLLYGVNSGGFVMLSGEVGTGKTTIIRCLLEQLPETADLAVVLNPSASARDLLCSICDEFRVDYAADETSLKVLTDKLTEFLVENHNKDRKSIVLIDEAQLLRISTLEQVRLLTNLETNTQKLLQIVLVGQPELNELLAKPALRQLSQRITARYHLRPLNEKETEAYIKHRLKVAGMPPGQQIFPGRIVRKIHQISRGIPRVINVLCDRMLLGAFSRESNVIDSAICKQATVEVLGEIPKKPTKNHNKYWHYYAGGAAASLAFILLLIFFNLGSGSEEASQSSKTVHAQSSVDDDVDQAAGSGKPWHTNQDHAVEELLAAIGVEHDSAIYPCWAVTKQGFKCETQKLETWDEIKAIDRPAVLTVIMGSRIKAYVTVVAIKASEVWVRHEGQIKTMNIEELGALWTGEMMFVWKRPDAFEEPVGIGSSGPMVNWVAEHFAQLDGQSAPLARDRFNKQLQKRVKLFQRSENLEDDGFVGLQTLLKLNEALGLEKSMSDLQLSLVSVEG